MYLRIGYFEDFKGANTVLLEGDVDGLQRLANLLRELANSNIVAVNLHRLTFVDARRDVQLKATAEGGDIGVCRVETTPHFTWHQSPEGWLECAEKIEVLIPAGKGHCYLGETPADDLVVMVSKGEYGDAWWSKTET